jgi:hypothetical protein
VQYLKHCLNPKVIAALAVIAAAIWIVAPGAFAAAWPVLVVAVCPLSMLAMMLLMRGSGTDAAPDPHAALPARQAGGAEDTHIAALRAQIDDMQARLAAVTDPAEPADGAAGPAPDPAGRR